MVISHARMLKRRLLVSQAWLTESAKALRASHLLAEFVSPDISVLRKDGEAVCQQVCTTRAKPIAEPAGVMRKREVAAIRRYPALARRIRAHQLVILAACLIHKKICMEGDCYS